MVSIKDLKKQVLLKELNDEEIGKIAGRVEIKKYLKGDVIFKEGSETKGIFMIHSGKVEISKVTPDGWKQTLAAFKDGHFFGELSIIEDRKLHGADALAIENADLYFIKTGDFKDMEKTDPSIMYKIMKTIARVASRNVHLMNEKLMKLLISY